MGRIDGDNMAAMEPLQYDGQIFTPNIQHEGTNDFNSIHSSDPSVSNSHRNRPCGLSDKAVCITVIVAALASLVSVTVAIFAAAEYGRFADELKIARENRQKICLPCDAEAIHKDDWKPNHNGECCAKLEHLLVLLDKLVKQKVDSELSKASDSNQARYSVVPALGNSSGLVKVISAHLGIGSKTTTGSEAVRLVGWQTDDQHKASHITTPELTYDQTTGSIHVSTAGYYYIYSQIDTITHESDANETPYFYHTIWSREQNSPGDSKLFQAVTMKWQMKILKQFSQQVSYVGGSAYIAADTNIFVTFSEPSSVNERQPWSNFFGLYRL